MGYMGCIIIYPEPYAVDYKGLADLWPLGFGCVRLGPLQTFSKIQGDSAS